MSNFSTIENWSPGINAFRGFNRRYEVSAWTSKRGKPPHQTLHLTEQDYGVADEIING